MENVSSNDKSEIINKALTVARAIIVHYLESNYFKQNPHEETNNALEASRFEEELQRIDEIFSDIEIILEEEDSKKKYLGLNHGDNKIEIVVKDINNITLQELLKTISVIIHEVYHSVSKLSKYALLEEGYVSLITSQTIRYSIDNPIDIPGIMNADELKSLLETQELINGYGRASAFVRSAQVILRSNGIDSCYEYMFNGVEKLINTASMVRPELGNLFFLQKNKAVLSPLLTVEEELLWKSFKDIDVSDISVNDVEMNWILKQYLKDKCADITDKKVQEMLNDSSNGELYDKLKDFSDEQLLMEFGKRKR